MTVRALLFTDVVDSTLLVERLGDERAAQVWAAHDRHARDLLVHHHGREIDRTDGFFLLFDEAVDAARYALAYHLALAGLALEARVGLHVGPVTLRENTAHDVARGAKPTEVEGLAKPFAARVMALAAGGQTLLSVAAQRALGGALPDDAEIESHGHYRLKGLEEPVELFELGLRGRCAFAPPADTDKVYRVVRANDVWQPVREVRHNLPAERDAFVGRTAELRALAARLDAGVRLLTVLGPGGTGKTRFVRRYGRAWLGDWPGGVYFCDLSEARSLDGIHFAVAFALDVPLGKSDPVVQLGHAIAGRGRCLLILDNFEQVIEHAAGTVGLWADRAGEAAFVVTSRERLHLPGEEIFPVEPLPLDKDAIDLFVARAHAQKPDFALTKANRAAVARIVSLLDGLPLAIELAAARVRVLSPAQLVDRMRDRFQVLAGARGAATRQATLAAAIDWSWDLLTPWEQSALAQCSVFEGGFTLEAAEAVLDLARWPESPPAIDAVQALVDKSLLRTWVPAEQARFDLDEPYFGMYLSIHEYAGQKLRVSGSQVHAAAEERHGRYFSSFGTDEALEALFLHGGVRRRRALALELDNLVVACRRAVGRGDGHAAVAAYQAAWEVLDFQGPSALGADLGAQVLALDGMAASLRAAALVTRALASRRAGLTEEAGTWLEQALACFSELRNRRWQASIHSYLGNLHREQGRIEEARGHLDVALTIHREVGNRRADGMVLGDLGNLHYHQGRVGDAMAHYEAALAIAREVGNRHHEGSALGNLGTLHREQGRVEEARAYYQQALDIHREVGDRQHEGNALNNLAILHQEQGQMEEARTYYQQALNLIREVGHRRAEGSVLGNLGVLHLDQGRMEEARTCYDRARAISREVGDRRFEGMVLGNLGTLHWHQGRVAEARAHYEAALATHRAVGNRREEGIILDNLGVLHRDQGRTEEAQAHFEAALAVHREVGSRREEGIVFANLGVLQRRQGRIEEAQAQFEVALAIIREVGDCRAEGVVLGNLANLLVQQGCITEAREALRCGEAHLRMVGDRLELAKLLCARGRAEAAAGDFTVARATLAEAEPVAAALGAGPDSELCREIATLREVLA